MTTIVGIKSNQGLEGIVVASDRQASLQDSQGNIEEKFKSSKIFSGNFWIIVSAGGKFIEIHDFYRKLKEKRRKDHPILRALETGIFQEYLELNLNLGKSYGSTNAIASVMAVNTGNSLELFKIDQFGYILGPENKNFFYYTSIGAGSLKATDSIRRKIKDMDPDNLTLPQAIDLARGAIHEAESDPYSGFGLDFAVLTKDKVHHFTKGLDAGLKKFEDDYFKDIKRKFSGKR